MPKRERDRGDGFVFKPRDYLNDPAVLRMTTQERGAYTTLLFHLWGLPEPGVVEDNDSVLAKLSWTTPDEWREVREAVCQAFDKSSRPGFWVQKRLVAEHAAQRRWFESVSTQRRSAANSRWDNEKHATAMQPHCNRNASAMHPDADFDFDSDFDSEEEKSKHLSGKPDERAKGSIKKEPDPPSFAAFYVAYPRKDGRAAAVEAYREALRRQPEYKPADLAWAAARYAKKVAEDGTEPRFVAMAKTWLNEDRFRDFFDEED